MKRIVVLVCCMLSALSASDRELTTKLGPPYYWGGIIPTPQKAEFNEGFLELADIGAKSVKCVIALPDNAAAAVRAAADMLSEDFGKLGLKPEIMTYAAAKKSGKPIIRLGESLTVKNPEGYELHIASDGVRCLGSDPRGTYYAAVSLRQLMKIDDGKLKARFAEITDYPTVLLRTAGSSTYTEPIIRWAGDYKINTLTVSYYGNAPWNRKDLNKYTEQAAKLSQEKGFFDLSCFINPWCTKRTAKGAERINIAKEADVELLYNHFRILGAAGVRSFMLCADDFCRFVDRKCLPSYPEEEQKFGTLEASHIYLANTIFHRLKKEFPKFDFYFCPPFYSISHVTGAGDPAAARRYLSAIGKELDPEIGIILTGPVVTSLEINADQLAAMRQLLSGRTPFIWDNPSGHYFAGRTCSNIPGGYFKPFTTKYVPELLSRIIPFNSNLSAGKPALLLPIVLISSTNLLWNPAAYNAETSLRQALMSYAGPESADNLIKIESIVQEIIQAENTSPAQNITIEKEFFREDFETETSYGPMFNHKWLSHKVQEADAPSGKFFVRAESKEKQYILRSSNKAFNIPLKDVVDNGYFVFDLRASRPEIPVRVILNCNQSKGIFLDQHVVPPDTAWHRYVLPLSGFKITGAPEYLSGYSIFNPRNYEEPVTFEVDNVIIGVGKHSTLDSMGRLLDKLEFAEKEAEKSILNPGVLEGTRNVYEKYRANYARMQLNLSGPYTVAQTTAAPTDELWEKTAQTTPFIDYRDGQKNITGTYAQALYSPTHLFVRYYCTIPADQPDKPTPDNGRDSLADSDAVELFLDPGFTREKYFHLGINTIGSRLDSRNNGKRLDRNWNPDWELKITKGQGFWVAVMSIPFKSLDIDAPSAGQVWGANFCRSNIPFGEYGAWKCPYGAFHNPKMFGIMKFE